MNVFIVLMALQLQLGPSLTEKFRKNWVTVKTGSITKKTSSLTPVWSGEINTDPVVINGKKVVPPKPVVNASSTNVLQNIRNIKYGDLKKGVYSINKDLWGNQCLNTLRSLGIAYKPGPKKRGIVNPVTILNPVINGVTYRWIWGEKELFMECHFALSLYLAGPIFLKYGYDEVLYSSIYRYTRIAGTRRLSRHATGNAIDIYVLRGKNGRIFVMKRDWIRVYGDEKNCVGAVGKSEGVNARRLTCELEQYPIFRRILTPDYDHGHRDHFHVSGPTPGETWRRDGYAGRYYTKKLSTYHHVKRLDFPVPKRYPWLDGKTVPKKPLKTPPKKPVPEDAIDNKDQAD